MTACVDCAYLKVLLHASKYPAEGVAGILLGKIAKDTTTVMDILPLCHMHSSLTPLLDICILLAKALCSTNGLTIVGCYAANEVMDDNQVSKASAHMMARIKETAPNAIFWQVINSHANPDSNSLAVATYTSSKKGLVPAADGSISFVQPYKWKNDGLQVTSANGTFRMCRNAMKNYIFEDLVDFDEHLQSIGLDFLNSKVNTKVATNIAAENAAGAVVAAILVAVTQAKKSSK